MDLIRTGAMALQFTNLQTDPTMNAFFEFIQKLEFQWMKFLDYLKMIVIYSFLK